VIYAFRVVEIEGSRYGADQRQMIYLDVTGSCKSAKSTGIQRATRTIFRELNQRESVLPISWNLIGNCYQRLGRRELQILQDPFRDVGHRAARPDLRGEH